MRIYTYIIILLFPFALAQAQITTSDTTATTTEYYIIEGDTIPRSSIDLNEVIVFKRLKFKNNTERRRYLILRRKTRKVFPYAKLAADRLVALNERLDSIEGKRARKKYTKMTK